MASGRYLTWALGPSASVAGDIALLPTLAASAAPVPAACQGRYARTGSSRNCAGRYIHM